ncbi:MAG TPA: PDZ domain-containing protein [Vicinamibacteria bacterium]|jgi:type II secretion system protein C|nr:PDZ domain-containing protein [Vicinamibacteria bacterium]
MPIFMALLAATVATAAVTAPPDLAAIGVVVSPHAEHSVVLLRSGGRTRALTTGESAFGGRVVTIAVNRVTIDFGGRLLDLRINGGTVEAAAAPRATPIPAPAVEVSTDEAAVSARTMERREVDRRLGEEVPRILAETTLLPVTEGGQVAGFTLTRVPEGTLLTDAGLRAGDVITSVNDVPINSLATLLSLWPRLQNESVLRAIVLRQGRPVSISVTLR